jgi:hypothetical protein
MNPRNSTNPRDPPSIRISLIYNLVNTHRSHPRPKHGARSRSIARTVLSGRLSIRGQERSKNFSRKRTLHAHANHAGAPLDRRARESAVGPREKSLLELEPAPSDVSTVVYRTGPHGATGRRPFREIPSNEPRGHAEMLPRISPTSNAERMACPTTFEGDGR